MNCKSPTSPFCLLNKLLAGILLLAATAALAKGEPTDLLGVWVLNSELTHELQPKQSGGGVGGFGSPTISIGGVGVPLPGGSSSAASSGTARDPRVLRCDAMTVTMTEEDVHFLYNGSGEETMRTGNDHGRKTSWSTRKLTQKYSTNVRKVRKTYELDDDGRLIVRVKISPKGAKSATHIRVFERPTG